MIDPSQHAEAEYDRLDDMGQFDAAEIRARSGFEGDGTNTDFTADAIRARNPDVAFGEPTPQGEVTPQPAEQPDVVPAPHPTDHQHYKYNERGWQLAMQNPQNYAGFMTVRAAVRPYAGPGAVKR